MIGARSPVGVRAALLAEPRRVSTHLREMDLHELLVSFHRDVQGRDRRGKAVAVAVAVEEPAGSRVSYCFDRAEVAIRNRDPRFVVLNGPDRDPEPLRELALGEPTP